MSTGLVPLADLAKAFWLSDRCIAIIRTIELGVQSLGRISPSLGVCHRTEVAFAEDDAIFTQGRVTKCILL
jgi:hypothetical protein